MDDFNRNNNNWKWRHFLLFICVLYCSLSAILSVDIVPVKRYNLLAKSQNRDNVKREIITSTTVPPNAKPSHHYHKPLAADDSLIIPKTDTYKVKIEGTRDKKISKTTVFHHFINNGERKRKGADGKNTSVLGVMFLSIIMVVVASTLFIMLVCFVHKWKENMGSHTTYPKVEYSMLRQGEDEPEDPLGEILINIGLAAPEDIRPLSETESEDAENTKISSFEPSLSTLSSQDPLNVCQFTTIPLENDESTQLIPKKNCDESDEEMLQ